MTRNSQERANRLRELATTQVTVLEIADQTAERARRARRIALEMAGDLDEEGEGRLCVSALP